jgi:TP901 family phage tail tape measure protein
MSDFESKVRIDIDAGQALAQIKLLQRQISDFHSSMAKGSATANLKSLQMQQSLVDTINATGQYSAQMKTVASSTQAFTTSLEKNKLSLNQYFKYAGGASRSFGKLFKTEMDTIQKVAIERVKDLQTQYIKMGRDANGALKTIAVRPLALDMENLSTKTQIAAQKQQLLNQLLKQGSTNLLNFGKNTQWAGRQLMVGFTIPLGILGASAAKTFMEMEKQAVSFKRVYGDTFTASAETDKMLKQVKDLASEFTKYGVAVEKTMESAAKAAATGKMGADLIAQVSESTRLSVLGNVEQQKALETTISLTNAFGTSADELRGKINFLNAVENQTVTSIEDLTTAIPKAAPVIKQLGGNVEDLSFFLTAMREGGINASEGANALKSGLASLINPTNKASKMLEGFGINIQSIVQKNKGDVKGLVIDFAKALDTLDPLNRARAIEQLFGKFQFSRLSTLFQNVIKQGSQAAKVLELTKQSSAELGILAQKELNRISSSPMYKFQKAVADFKKELAPVGEEFIKAVTPLIKFGTDVLKSFNNLDGGVKQFIITTTGVIAGLGPIMLMTFGLIANGVANLIKGFSFVKSIFNKTTTASQVLGETTDYMTQQQIEAAAVAASLDQVHNKLTQSFTVEAEAVANLAAQYQKAISAQVAFSGVAAGGGKGKAKAAPKKYASGIFSVPGPKGAGDIVPAMLSPGEAVIPAGPAQKYRGFIKGMIAGRIPGFEKGIDYVDAFQQKARSAPDAINRQTQKMHWDTFDAEQQAGLAEAEAIIKEQNLSQSRADNLRNNYSGKEASHTAPATRTVKIGNRKAQQKIFNSKTVTPDARVFNQGFANLIEKRVGIPGKTYSTGSFIGDILNDKKKMSEMAKSVGLPVSILRKELESFDPMRPGGAQYPTTKNAFKAFEAVAKVSKNNPGRIAAAALRVRNANYGKPGTREAAIAAGGLRYDPTQDAKAAQQEETLRKRFDNKAKSSKDVKKTKTARTNNTNAVNKNTQAVNADTAETKKGTRTKRDANKTAAKTKPTPTIAVTEQLGNNITRTITSTGKVQYRQNGKFITAEVAQSLIGETPSSKKTSRFGKVGSFLSRRGALGGLGMAASLGGNMMGGDIGNTLANVGNAAFIADVGRSFIPAGAKAKLATFGVEKLLPILKNLAPMFLKLGLVLTVATTAYEIFTANAKKQAEISKAVVDTLSMSKDKLDKVNEFFGTDAQLSGIRTLSVAGEGQTGKQASLAEQFRTSDQFKSLYGDQANQLRGATDKQFAITMQSLALDLYGQGVGAEQVQIIVDAIKKEAQKTNVVIKFKDLTLDTETGRQNLAKSIKEITDGMVKELQSQRDWLGLNWLASANIDAYTSQLSGFISALSQEFEKGRISVTEFQTSFSRIEQSFYQAEKANPGDGLSYLNDVLQKTSPEVAFASAGITDFNNKLMVTKLAAKGAAMSTQLLADVAAGDINAIDYLDDLNKFEDKKSSDMIKQQKIISGISAQQKNLQKQETAVNNLYDKRITALERIDSLNQSISDRQKGQLDLADALSQGDVFRAAQAMQQIRADEAKVALEQQKNSLQDARDKQTGALQNKQDNLDGALTSAQSKLNDISNTQMDPYLSKINSKTMEQLFTQYGWLYKLTNINLWFADPDTVKKEFGKYVSGNKKIANSEDPLGMFKGKKGNVLPNGFGPAHADGGHITGAGSGTSDSIPAMLSNGEYVIRANAVKAIGTDALDKLNQADRIKFANGGLAGFRMSEHKGTPKKQRFGLDDIAAGLTNPIIQGGANGTDVMGGFATAESYMNVASGKGGFFDYLTAILTPFALTGFGGASKAGMFGKLASKLPGGIKATALNQTARHRSIFPIKEVYHPLDVATENAKTFGPGTYFGKNSKVSDTIFRDFGNESHKITTTPKAAIKTLFSKGYANIEQLTEEWTKNSGRTSYIQNWDKLSKESKQKFVMDQLDGMTFDDPFIQNLIAKGYTGFKNGDVLSNWMVGVPGSGYGLKHLPTKLPSLGMGAIKGLKGMLDGLKSAKAKKIADRQLAQIKREQEEEEFMRLAEEWAGPPRPLFPEGFDDLIPKRAKSKGVEKYLGTVAPGGIWDYLTPGQDKYLTSLFMNDPERVQPYMNKIYAKWAITPFTGPGRGIPNLMPSTVKSAGRNPQDLIYNPNSSEFLNDLVNVILPTAKGQSPQEIARLSQIKKLVKPYKKDLSKMPGGIRAALEDMFAIHRSFDPNLKTVSQSKVKSQSNMFGGPLEGPGTYTSGTLKISDQFWSDYAGDNLYRQSYSNDAFKQILSSKGYADDNIIAQTILSNPSLKKKYGDIVEDFGNGQYGVSLQNLDISNPIFKKLMKDGYVGYRGGPDRKTNWMIGQKGFGLEKFEPNINSLLGYAKGGMVRGYAPGGPVVKTDSVGGDPSIDWLNSFVQNLLGGGNPSSFMQNDQTKNMFVSGYNQGAKNAGIDFTDPMFYLSMMPFGGLGAIGKLSKGIKGLKNFAKPFVRKDIIAGKSNIPSYQIGKVEKPFVFQGYGQNFSGTGKKGVNITKVTPEGLLSAALEIKPKDKKLQMMLNNFKENKIGANEEKLLDEINAAVGISENLTAPSTINTDGFALILSSLTGNKAAQKIIGGRMPTLFDIIQKNLAKTKSGFEGADNSLSAMPSTIPVIRSSKYPFEFDKNGNIVFSPLAHYAKYSARGTQHFTLEDVVKTHMQGQWADTEDILVTRLDEMIKANGLPDNLYTADAYWNVGPGKQLVVPKGTFNTIKSFKNTKDYVKELVNRKLIQPGETPPLLAVDPDTNQILRLFKKEYTDLDREMFVNQFKTYLPEGRELEVIKNQSIQLAKKQIGIDTRLYNLEENGALAGEAWWGQNRQMEIQSLGRDLNIPGNRHGNTPAGTNEHSMINSMWHNPGGVNQMPGFESYNRLQSADMFEQIRWIARQGHYKTQSRKDKPLPLDYFRKMDLANGGLVNIPKFKNGGMFRTSYASGGLAMLHDKEFVMNPGAVKEYGVDKLKAMNNGTYNSGSVYNSYGVNINVGGSNSNASDIARTVIREIKKIDSQQIRSTRI